MKLSKSVNVLFFGLTLVLTLVSYSGVTNQWPNKTTKTTLLFSDISRDSSFCFKFENLNIVTLNSLIRYSEYSFQMFKKSQNLKEKNSYLIYVSKSLWVRPERIQSIFHCFTKQKTPYISIV